MYAISNVAKLPESAGIYAIVHTCSGERYVGRAVNLRTRVRDHFRGLTNGRPESGDKRIFDAWQKYGEAAFHVEILEHIDDNERKTHYHTRPHNLALAEQYYVRQRAELSLYLELVARKWDDLIKTFAWRQEMDEQALQAIDSASPTRSYRVGKRVTQEHAIIVSAFDEQDAKRRTKTLSKELNALGGNLSAKRLTIAEVASAILAGVPDNRQASLNI